VIIQSSLPLALVLAAQSAAAPSPPPAEPAPAVVAPPTGAPDELLEQARSLYDQLEYDRVIPYAEAVLARDDADVDQRLDAYLLHGASLAIVGNAVDAEKPFRFLLRGRPDFDLPAQTPPKILAVFRKVQVEEQAIRDQMKALEHSNIVASLAVDDAEPLQAHGGRPAEFAVVVRDPRGAVAGTTVRYRRAGEPRYSSLPLSQDPSGRWRGSIPGEWTENEAGFTLEYVVSTSDAAGVRLLEAGSDLSPLRVAVAPGTVADAAPFYTTFWFWGLTGVATATVLGSAATVGYLATRPPQSDLGELRLP
jgi:hypothetical protein